MSDRPRLLLIGPPPGSLSVALPATDVEPVSTDLGEVAMRLRDGDFTAVLATPEVVSSLLDRFRRDELILSHIDKGLAVLDPEGKVVWANRVFRSFSTTDPVGQPLLTALGARVAAVETPSASARRGIAASGVCQPVRVCSTRSPRHAKGSRRLCGSTARIILSSPTSRPTSARCGGRARANRD